MSEQSRPYLQALSDAKQPQEPLCNERERMSRSWTTRGGKRVYEAVYTEFENGGRITFSVKEGDSFLSFEKVEAANALDLVPHIRNLERGLKGPVWPFLYLTLTPPAFVEPNAPEEDPQRALNDSAE